MSITLRRINVTSLVLQFNTRFILQHNHLIGLKRTYLKLVFLTVDNLIKVKKDIFSAVRKNQSALKRRDTLEEAAGWGRQLLTAVCVTV